MKRNRVIAIGVAAAVVLAAGGGIAYATLSGVASVGTATAATGDLSVTVSASGTVASGHQRGVFPPAAGTIAKVLVSDGAKVRAGQSLIQMNTGPLELALATARATLATARAAGQTASSAAPTGNEHSGVRKSVTAAQSALSTAKKNYSAYRSDYNNASSSEQSTMASTLRTLKTGVAQAEANLAVAKGSRDRLDRSGQVRLAQTAASLSAKAAQLAVDQAQANLDHADLTAPIDGTVNVPGSVQAGAGLTPGVAIVEVSDPGSVVFEAAVDETDISGVTAGEPATVTLDAFADSPITGKVLSRAATATTTATGGVAFTTRVSLPAGSIQPLAGMGGSAEITTKQLTGVVIVPTAAVLSSGDGHYVFRIAADNTAHKQEVQVGAQNDTTVQITSGLATGDRVATTGASTLSDGQSVKAA